MTPCAASKANALRALSGGGQPRSAATWYAESMQDSTAICNQRSIAARSIASPASCSAVSVGAYLSNCCSASLSDRSRRAKISASTTRACHTRRSRHGGRAKEFTMWALVVVTSRDHRLQKNSHAAFVLKHADSITNRTERDRRMCALEVHDIGTLTQRTQLRSECLDDRELGSTSRDIVQCWCELHRNIEVAIGSRRTTCLRA